MLKKILFLLLLLPAPLCGKEERLRPKKYIHISESKNWDDARAYCVEHHVDLLIIRSEEHNVKVKHGEGWIGLRRETSRSEWKWTTGEIADYGKWKNSQIEDGKDCAFKKKDRIEWEQYECDKTEKSLCVGETLLLVQEEKTWEEALQHCRSLVSTDGKGTDPKNHDYDLVSLLTADDYIYAREKAQAATTDEVWTGLRFLAGQWFWVDGEPMQYPKTDECSPNISCGTLGKKSTDEFHKRMCEETRNFLCFKKAKP